MSRSPSKISKELLEILVAVAWVDGEIQPEEQAYLTKLAADRGWSTDVTVQQLLSDRQPISSAQCYQLLHNYLGANPSVADYQDLFAKISSLVYSDENIATEEAKLLTQLQELDPQNLASNSVFDKVLAKIQRLYKKAVASV